MFYYRLVLLVVHLFAMFFRSSFFVIVPYFVFFSSLCILLVICLFPLPIFFLLFLCRSVLFYLLIVGIFFCSRSCLCIIVVKRDYWKRYLYYFLITHTNIDHYYYIFMLGSVILTYSISSVFVVLYCLASLSFPVHKLARIPVPSVASVLSLSVVWAVKMDSSLAILVGSPFSVVYPFVLVPTLRCQQLLHLVDSHCAVQSTLVLSQRRLLLPVCAVLCTGLVSAHGNMGIGMHRMGI